MSPADMEPSMPKSFLGINHLKLPARDMLKTHAFYTTIFPFEPLPQYNHYDKDKVLFAVMFQHPETKLIVEVRQNKPQAEAQAGSDPITWGVQGREDLQEWVRWFDSKGVKHSPILKGVKGWLLAAEDPDGRFVRLYTEEEHEWTNHPDEDDYWIGPLYLL